MTRRLSQKHRIILSLLSFIAIIFVGWWIGYSHQESYLQELKPLGERAWEASNKKNSIEAPLSLSDHTIYTTPNTDLIKKIAEQIDEAKTQVLVEVYILSEKEIKAALKRAKARWIRVEVILENELYGSDVLSTNSRRELMWSGVEVIAPDHEQFTFTHSKFMIIDDNYIVSSWNFAYSSFKDNKEFVIFWRNKEVHSYLERLFENDKKHKIFNETISWIFISPVNARSTIEDAIESAQSSIVLTMQSLADESIVKLLESKAQSGIEVSICLGDTKKVSWNDPVAARLIKSGVKVSAPKKPYIHTKSLLIDGYNWYIGSINYTTNSIDRNREVWLYLKLDESASRVHMQDYKRICSTPYTPVWKK
jgi:cardiolipin synthase